MIKNIVIFILVIGIGWLGFNIVHEGSKLDETPRPVENVPSQPENNEDTITPPVEEAEVPEIVACTMEAKQCPDGSFVGRTGPHCEFAACPPPEVDRDKENQIESSFYLEDSNAGKKVFVDNTNFSPKVYVVENDSSRRLVFDAQSFDPGNENIHLMISEEYTRFSPGGNYLRVEIWKPETGAGGAYYIDLVNGSYISSHMEIDAWPRYIDMGPNDAYMILVAFNTAYGDDDLYVSQGDNLDVLLPVFVTDYDEQNRMFSQVDSRTLDLHEDEVYFDVKIYGYADESNNSEIIRIESYSYNVVNETLTKLE